MSGSFFLDENDYCEKTREIDLMLETFAKDRENIISLLKQKPNELVKLLWSKSSPVCKDDNCLFEMGKNMRISLEDRLENKCKVFDSMTNLYICPQCKNMRRLIDFNKVIEREPFVLECGEKAGSELFYDKVTLSKLYLILEKNPNSIKNAYMNPSILDLAKCTSCSDNGSSFLKKYENISYLGSDPFTNNVLINWYLQKSSPNISNILISWICNKKGYNLYELSDIGTLNSFQDFPDFLKTNGKPSPTAKADDKSPLKDDVVLGIIVQLFALLHTLKKYDFSHGNPNTNAMKFKNEPLSYIIDGVHVTSPVTLKIEDFSTSGCTVLESETRLYSKSVIADEELKRKNYEPIVENVKKLENKVMVYRIKNPKKNIKSNILFTYMKHLGLPVYSSSFDAYSFMIVLLCEKGFYSTVMSNSILLKFWKDMWVYQEDFSKVNERLNNYHEKTSLITAEDVAIILSGLNLRCDMIDFGWENIKRF